MTSIREAHGLAMFEGSGFGFRVQVSRFRIEDQNPLLQSY